MHTLRTRFGKDIVAEFLPPRRPSKRAKVIIFATGMPAVPHSRALLDFFSKKGYWVFHPRYRGSWESGGQFLARSPHEDILQVIDGLPRRFKDAWSGARYRVKPSFLAILASSFGGPAGILASRDPRVHKVVVFSPVVDWRAPSKEEPLGPLFGFVQEAFGEGYRVSRKNWRKLSAGTFYNPAAHTKEIDGSKLLLIHAKDDRVVLAGPVKKFALTVGARLLMLPRGGHLSSSNFIKPKFYRRIATFLKQK